MWKGNRPQKGKEHVAGALMVFHAIPGRVSAKKLEASQSIETQGLAEGLLDPASNWVAMVIAYQPHISSGLTKQPLSKSGCEGLCTASGPPLHHSTEA